MVWYYSILDASGYDFSGTFQEAPSEDPMHVKKILGHHFAKQGKAPGNYFCDSCGATIWALLHTLYKCQGLYIFTMVGWLTCFFF